MTLFDLLSVHLSEGETMEDLVKKVEVRLILSEQVDRGYGGDPSVGAKAIASFLIDGVEIETIDDYISISL